MGTDTTRRRYYLDIVTADADDAGTDGNVHLKLCDPHGVSTVEQVLNRASHDRLSPGETDRHFLTVPPEFTEPHHAIIRLASGCPWLLHELRITTFDARIRYTTGACDIRLSRADAPGDEGITLPLALDQHHPDRAVDPGPRHARTGSTG